MSGRESAPTTPCSQKGTYDRQPLIIVCRTVYIVQAMLHEASRHVQKMMTWQPVGVNISVLLNAED
jgi:hypothetical protein